MELISETSGKRADAFLAEHTDMTRSYIAKLIGEGRLEINGKAAKSNTKLKYGDVLRLEIPPIAELEVSAQDIPLDIVYEDKDIIVINKPQGMVVHPAPGNPDGTLVNALMAHCGGSLSGINGIARPGIVHRIDKDTSGLLIIAKTNEAHLCLAGQIKEHTCAREYAALVHGRFKETEGIVNAPIGRNPKDRKKMCVTDKCSKSAVTHYRVLEHLGEYSLVECRLETGRTHQIRVHMSHIGHPVACDPVYGVKKEKLKANGQLLHAFRIGFTHPSTGRHMSLTCPLPEYFEKILETLRKKTI